MPLFIAALTSASLVVAASDTSADWLGKATGPVVLALVVLALLRGTLVTGRENEALRADRDALRVERDKALELVYKQAEVAGRALDVSERK